jgi:hypothetical protein
MGASKLDDAVTDKEHVFFLITPSSRLAEPWLGREIETARTAGFTSWGVEFEAVGWLGGEAERLSEEVGKQRDLIYIHVKFDFSSSS